MAGKPGRSGGPRANSGGARPGAGRPRKEPEQAATRDPLEFLLDVMQGRVDANATQVRAAVAAAQYLNTRTKDGGKKEQRQADAAEVAAGRFAPKAPPKLAAVK